MEFCLISKSFDLDAGITILMFDYRILGTLLTCVSFFAREPLLHLVFDRLTVFLKFCALWMGAILTISLDSKVISLVLMVTVCSALKLELSLN